MAEPKFGELYVHIDEDGNAVSVAKHGGKTGAWRGISIARMGVPDEHKNQKEINALARQFAASPLMLAALCAFVNAVREDNRIPDHADDDYVRDTIGSTLFDAYQQARTAIDAATRL